MKKTWKIGIGIVVWLCILTIFFTVWCTIPKDKYNAIIRWTQQEKNKYTQQPLKLKILFDGWTVLRSADKIYLSNINIKNVDKFSKNFEIGTIYKKKYYKNANKTVLYVHIYPKYKKQIGRESVFRLVNEPGTPAWVISKLLPKKRRKELLNILEEYLRIHTNDIQEKLMPIITEMTKESYELLQKNFSVVMEKNKKNLLKKLKEAEKKHIDEEIQDLWDKVIWPIVLEESDPVLSPIVQKLWRKFPKSKIVMLWVYQSLPGTDNDHVQKKIEDYLQDKAVPIVEDNKKELAKLFVTITNRVSKNDKVKQRFLKIFKSIFSDKDLLEFLKSVFVELYKVNKNSFAEKLKEKWSDKEIQMAFRDFSSEFEPYLVKMINHVLIKENREIRSELAQVLRRQILYKDKYYLHVTPGNEKINSEDIEFEGF